MTGQEYQDMIDHLCDADMHTKVRSDWATTSADIVDIEDVQRWHDLANHSIQDGEHE